MSTREYPLTVVLETADTPNKNRRIYPSEVLLVIVGHRQMMGELYPAARKKEATDWTLIELENVSHLASNFRMEGKQLLCDITPYGPRGAALEKMLDEGSGNVAFALRGACELISDEFNNLIVNNYNFITVDLVEEKS